MLGLPTAAMRRLWGAACRACLPRLHDALCRPPRRTCGVLAASFDRVLSRDGRRLPAWGRCAGIRPAPGAAYAAASLGTPRVDCPPFVAASATAGAQCAREAAFRMPPTAVLMCRGGGWVMACRRLAETMAGQTEIGAMHVAPRGGRRWVATAGGELGQTSRQGWEHAGRPWRTGCRRRKAGREASAPPGGPDMGDVARASPRLSESVPAVGAVPYVLDQRLLQ